MDSFVKTDLSSEFEHHSYTAGATEDTLPQPSKDVVLSKREIGERVKMLRQAREMTQAQLAKAIGTHAPNISSIEHGLRGVSIQQVVKISKALEVSPEEILGRGKRPKSKAQPPSPKLLRRLERIQRLPKPRQRTLLELVDAYLDKHSSGAV
jgi:transcriptional regulator with XRE-family HTH domain